MSVRDSAFTMLKCVQTIFLVAVLLTIQTCKCKSDCHHYDYYHGLETALINDTENLFKLKQLFFPVMATHDPEDIAVLRVCVAANDQMSKGHNSTLKEKCWTFEYSSTLLTGVITPAQLYAFESITTLLLVNSAVNFHKYYAGYDETIKLHIESFPCTISLTNYDLYRNLITLTSWFKAYARAHGVPHKWKEEDKGYVAIWYGYWNSEDVANYHDYHHLFRVCLWIVFILLNITVTLLLLRFVPQYYNHLVKTVAKSSSHAINISWAIVLFTTGWNIILYTFYAISYGFILYSLRVHCFNTNPSPHCPPEFSATLYRDDSLSYITKVVTLSIALVVYLLLAVCTPKVSKYPIPYSIQKLCCCVFCFCCCCRSKHSKIIQTIVLWNILLFIHFTAMTTIPIGIFLFLAPTRTILVLATYFTFLLSIPVVISHILEFITSRRRNTVHQSSVFCMYQCIQLTAVITLMALVIIVLLLYLQILLKGVNTRGAYGIIWSILPSFILSLVGWYMKWKFSRQQELQEVLNNGYSSLETDSDNIEEII